MADLLAPPTSFPQFSRLPPELRDMIWRFCLPSRVVEVKWESCFRPPPGVEEADANWMKINLELPVVPPLISRVCRESRMEALRRAEYKTERRKKLPRRPDRADKSIPRKRAHGRLWFDKSVDMIGFDAMPWETARRFLSSNNDYDDRKIAPEFRKLLSDPSVPLYMNYSLHVNGSPYHRKPRYWRTGFVEWALDCIAKRKECTVRLGSARLAMHYQEACELGLFGLFAEEGAIYIDINDDVKSRKLQAIEETGKVPWKSGAFRDYLQGPGARNDIATFLTEVWLLWLQKEKLMSRNLRTLDLPLSAQAAQSVDRLPKFKFVIAVRLTLLDRIKTPWPGHVEMGFLRSAD